MEEVALRGPGMAYKLIVFGPQAAGKTQLLNFGLASLVFLTTM